MAAVIAYDNLADVSTLSSPSTIVSGFPLSELQTRQLSSTCRSTTDSGGFRTLSVVVTRVGGFDPTKNYLVGFLGTGPGVSYISEIAYSNDGGSTWNAIPYQLSGYMFGANRALAIINPVVPPPVGSWNQVRVTLKANNAADAYISAGRFWFGGFLNVPNGCDAGWQLEFIDPGKLEFSAGLQAYESPRTRIRQLQMRFTGLPTSLALACTDDGSSGLVDSTTFSGLGRSFYDLIESVGATGELIAMPRQAGAAFVDRACIYGHLAQTPAIVHRAGPNFSTELTVVEER